MKKKLLLFNYFLQKLVDFEMEIVKIPTFKLALTNLLFYERGENTLSPMSESCGASIRYYLECLLYCVCMYDIDKDTGEHKLFDVFNTFKITGNAVIDMEIQQHLTKIYDEEEPNSPKLYGLTNLRRYKKIKFVMPIWVGNVTSLSQPEPCLETEHIDKALAELLKFPSFVRLLSTECKLDMWDVMLRSPQYRKQRIYGPEIFEINQKNAQEERKNFLMDSGLKPDENWARHILEEKCIFKGYGLALSEN